MRTSKHYLDRFIRWITRNQRQAQLPGEVPCETGFHVFISYSKEKEMAHEIAQALEGHTCSRWRKPRLKVFIDDRELGSGLIWKELEKNLDASRQLVLIASPKSAASSAKSSVAKELRYWSDNKDVSIHPLVTEGHVNTAQLRLGEISDVADTRDEVGGGPTNVTTTAIDAQLFKKLGWSQLLFYSHADTQSGLASFEQFKTNVVSSAFGVSNDTVRTAAQQVDDETIRIQRQFIAIILSIVFLLASLALFAWNQRSSAVKSQHRAIGTSLALESSAMITEDPFLALRLAALSSRGLDRTIETESSMLDALESHPSIDYFSTAHSDRVLAVTFSESLDMVASSDESGAIVTTDAKTGGTVCNRFAVENDRALEIEVHALTFAGDHLLSADDNGRIGLWDPIGCRSVGFDSGHGGQRVRAMASHERVVATGDASGRLRLWSISEEPILGLELVTEVALGREIRALDFSPDGSWVIATGDESLRVLVNLESLDLHWLDSSSEPANVFPKDADSSASTTVRAATFSPDLSRKMFATAADDGKIRFWSWHSEFLGDPLEDLSGNKIAPVQAHEDAIYALAFRPDGEAIASASRDESIRVWDTNHLMGANIRNEYGRPAAPLRFHSGSVRSISYVSTRTGDSRLVSGANDFLLAFSSPEREQRLARPVPGHSHSISALAHNPVSGHIASGDTNGQIKVWNPTSQEPSANETKFSEQSNPVTALAYSASGDHLAVATEDCLVRIFDSERLDVPLWTLSGLDQPTRPVTTMTFSPGGSHLVVGGDDGEVRLWRYRANSVTKIWSALASGETADAPCRTLQDAGTPKRWILDVLFDEQGSNLLVNAGPASEAWSWIGETLGQSHEQLKPPLQWVEIDSKGLGSIYIDDDILFWRGIPNTLVDSSTYDARIPDGNISSATVTGNYLAVGHKTGDVSIFSRINGRRLTKNLTAGSPQGNLLLLAIPGSSNFVSGANEGELLLWDLRPSTWADTICQIVGTGLSRSEWDQRMADERYSADCQ